jgi:hypothetical protein
VVAARWQEDSQTFMGHSSVTVIYDLYGHLLPGPEAEAAGLLDTYLAAQQEREAERARAADGVTGAQDGAQTKKALDQTINR